jgi:hypothetical protein
VQNPSNEDMKARITAKSTATRFLRQEIHQAGSIDEKYSKTIVSG